MCSHALLVGLLLELGHAKDPTDNSSVNTEDETAEASLNR